MKRYKVDVYTAKGNLHFEIETDSSSYQYLYSADDTSFRFTAIDGRIIIVPRHEACIEATPLVPETIWKEK